MNTQGSIAPAEARELASVLLKLADDCERLDAAALPHLDAFIAALEGFDCASHPKDYGAGGLITVSPSWQKPTPNVCALLCVRRTSSRGRARGSRQR